MGTGLETQVDAGEGVGDSRTQEDIETGKREGGEAGAQTGRDPQTQTGRDTQTL